MTVVAGGQSSREPVAFYQTVTTMTMVGFREVHPLSALGQLLILVGAGTATRSATSPNETACWRGALNRR